VIARLAGCVLCLAALAAPAVAQSTDTTIGVSPGTRLRLDLDAGKIEVRVWTRSAVQIRGAHAASTAIRTTLAAGLLSVSVTGRGVAECECTLTVPQGMALTLGGGDTEIRVAGTQAEVVARNYSGRITIDGGRETISAQSTLGEVTITNAHGRVSAKSLHAPIRISDVEGDVEAEGSSNHITLSGITSHRVSASTVGGVLNYAGRFFDDGHYTFATHMGSIFLTLPEPVNARVNVSTVRGAFSSALPHTRQDGPRRGRFTVVFGTGTATVEAQTFAGGIVVRVPDKPRSDR
jgi:DUF4097 and DUF4098 domain-containing protein YvlB